MSHERGAPRPGDHKEQRCLAEQVLSTCRPITDVDAPDAKDRIRAIGEKLLKIEELRTNQQKCFDELWIQYVAACWQAGLPRPERPQPQRNEYGDLVAKAGYARWELPVEKRRRAARIG